MMHSLKSTKTGIWYEVLYWQHLMRYIKFYAPNVVKSDLHILDNWTMELRTWWVKWNFEGLGTQMRDESPFSAFPFAHGMKLRRQADEHHIFCCIPIFCSLATDRKRNWCSSIDVMDSVYCIMNWWTHSHTCLLQCAFGVCKWKNLYSSIQWPVFKLSIL